MADGSIIIDTKIDTKTLSKELKTMVTKVNEGMQQASKVANVALAGITASIGALALATKNFSATTDRIDKMSQSLGMSRKAFQQWDFILSQNGVTIESMKMSMKTLSQEMIKEDTVLKKIGVSVKNSNGEFRKQEDVFKDVIVSLQGYEDSVTKSALAQQIFGRNGQELLPMLNQSKGSIDELMQVAEELGLVMGDDVVKAGVVLTDTMDQLKRSVSALFNNAIAPLIPQVTEILQSFMDWATEGNRLRNILESAINKITKAFTSGLIPALISGAIAIKGITTVMAILNAVMNANVVSKIIIGIGALIAGIVLLYKNWDIVVTFWQESIQKLISAHKIMGSMIVTALSVAFNSVKMVVVDLVLLIADKLLGGIQNLLEIAGKLPFVGHLFDGLATNVAGLKDGLAEVRDEAKKTNKELIKTALDDQKAFIEAERKKLAELKQAKLERIALMEKERQLSKEQAEAERKQAEEDEANRLAGLKTLELEISKNEQLLTAKENLANAEAIINQKVKDGFMDQEAGLNALVSEYEGMANTLYELGYVSSQFGSDGDKALFDLLARIKTLKFEIGQLGQEAGEELPKTIARGIKERMFEALGSVRQMTENISDTITRASKGDLAKATGGFLDVIGDIAQGVGQIYAGDIAGGIMSLASGIGGAFTLIENLAKGFWDTLVTLSKFSAGETLDAFQGVMDGLANFFSVELFQVSNMITAGEEMVLKLWEGIESNKDKIFTAIENIMETILNVVTRNQGTITAITGFVVQIATLIIENLPKIIEAGLMIVKSVGEGIMQNIDNIVDSVMGLVISIVEFIGDNLGLLVVGAMQIVIALAKGLLKNKALLTKAVMMLIPAILLAIVESLPELVEAFAELIPMLIISLITMQPLLIMAYAEMILKLVEVVASLIVRIPAIFVALFTGLVTGAIEGFTNLINTVASFGTAIADAFWSIGESAIQGWFQGLNSMGTMWDNMAGMFTQMVTDIKNFFGIHSPSTVFAGFGENIIQGLIDGLLGAGANLWDNVSSIFTSLTDNAKNSLGEIGDFAKDIFNGIGQGAGTALSGAGTVISTVSGVVDDVVGTALSGAGTVISTVSGVVDDVVGTVSSGAGTVISGAGTVISTVSNIGSTIGGFWGFSKGSAYIEQDQLAQIHQGERIVPKHFNESLMSGETIMMNPKSFSSILQGLQGGMSNPSINTLGGGIIKLVANIKGNIEVDGREIGRTAFQYVDSFAGVGYGS